MKKIFSYFARIAGPAAVVAAGTLGAGSTSTLVLAGAWFRYDLMWLVIAVLPLFIVTIDSASRIGLVNKNRGIFSLIADSIHPGLAWFLLVVNLPLNLLIAMAQMSIMSSAILSLFGYDPPAADLGLAISHYKIAESVLSLVLAGGIVWLLAGDGYQRLQKVMTAFMLLMLLCFFVVAVRGFQEIGAILGGLTPSFPGDLLVPSQGIIRSSGLTMIAISGAILAPAAMLGIPYMSADNRQTDAVDFRQEFYKSILNLGVFFGSISLLIIIAGGFALFPLPNHAEIDSVHEASRILVHAFPRGFEFLGSSVFTIGMIIAAFTTFVVTVEITCYFVLDMSGRSWHHTIENGNFRKIVMLCVVLPAVLAPLWTFPALLKNLLLMATNAIMIPAVFLTVIILTNKKAIMGAYTNNLGRNLMLLIAFVVSVILAVIEFPDLVQALTG